MILQRTVLLAAFGCGAAMPQRSSPAPARGLVRDPTSDAVRAVVLTRLHGRAVDQTGRAVRAVEITIENGGEASHPTTDPGGSFDTLIILRSGTLKLVAQARGYQTASAMLDTREGSPDCEVRLVLERGRKETAAPGSITCKDPVPPAPYASLPQVEAALGDMEFPASRGGPVMDYSSHIANGKAVSMMWLSGAYVMRISPGSPQPIKIRVSQVSPSAIWEVSAPEVVTLTKLDPHMARLDFLRDGEALLTIEDGSQVLRIQLRTTSADGSWEARLFRVTESGKVIDAEGNAH